MFNLEGGIMTWLKKLLEALRQPPVPKLRIRGVLTSNEVQELVKAIVATDVEIPLGEGNYVDVSNISMVALLKAHPDFYRKPTDGDPFNCDRWADVMVGAIRSAHPGVAACSVWLMENMKHAYVLYIADRRVWAVTQQTTTPVYWRVWKPLEVTRFGGGF